MQSAHDTLSIVGTRKNETAIRIAVSRLATDLIFIEFPILCLHIHDDVDAFGEAAENKSVSITVFQAAVKYISMSMKGRFI